MKKYLLSFLLISLTIIGDGYAAEGRCQLQEVKSPDVKINERYELDLKCKTNETYPGGNSYTARWTYRCEREVGMCKNNDYVLVWGGYKRGDQKDCPGNGKNDGYCTGLTVYKCSDDGLDHWGVYAHDPVSIMRDCSDISNMSKVKTEGDYGIYVKNTYSSFNKQECSTKAYAVKDFTKDICKKKIEKKCGRDPSDFYFSDRLFCPEEGVMKVYKPLYFNNERVWYDITYDDSIKILSCEDKPFGSDWKNWGKWTTVLSVFVKQAGAFASASEATGLVFGDYISDIRIDRPKDFCLWCEDTNMTPRKDGDTVVCVNETEYDGGGDSGGGDSSAESQVEQPAPVEPPKMCGVPCDGKKTIYCPNIPTANDSSVFYCPESGQNWQEIDAQAWCCNKKCTPPKTDLPDVGIWKVETGHHLYVKRGPISNDGAYNFYSEIKDDIAYGYNIEENCTACPTGTTYNKTTQKCK